MRYGFTGTRSLDDDGRALIDNALLMVADGQEFTTGSCVGVDAYVGRILTFIYPRAKHRVVVPANRKQVDYWWHPIEQWAEKGIDLTVELMPIGTSFRERNERIVDYTDELIVFASHPESHGKSRRSGTWMTKRIAEKRGVKIRPPYVFKNLCTSDEEGCKVSINDEVIERIST